MSYGTPLVEDPGRIGTVTALGLDETLFCRRGRWRRQGSCTSIVDVARPSQLLDERPVAWRDSIRCGVLDLCGPYRKTFTDSLPDAGQVADPFDLVKLANQRLDEHGFAKPENLLTVGDPRGEVRLAWHAKEVVRSIYDIADPTEANEFITRLAGDLQDESCPPEVRQLGRTIGRW